MKLISIEMSAFGPFKNKETIDFTRYDTDKIFLISGKTGSGKTTIFDAISYALFGKMTGEYRNESSIRSQYANREIDTYVNLIFEKDNIKYKIYRKPSYNVEGRKTKINGEAIFSRLHPNQKVLGTKANIINTQIEEIIGFKYAQFKQIVVLPQGEFIKILNSKSNEKEALLSTILDTHIYSLIADKVREDFNTLETKIGKVQQQLEIILQENKVANEEELKDKKNKKELEVGEISNIIDNLNKEIKELEDKIKINSDNNKNLNTLKELNHKKEELLNTNTDIENKKELLIKLQVINSIKGYTDNLEDLRNQERIKTSKIKELEQEFSKIKIEYSKLHAYKNELNELNESISMLKEYSTILNNLNETKNSIARNNNEISKLNVETIEINAKKENAIKDKNEYINQKIIINKDLDYKTKFINEYDVDSYTKVRDLYDSYKNRKALIEKIEDLENNLFNINENLENEMKELNELESREKDWKNIHKNNVLQNYLNELEEGKECPLCGSKNHPKILEKLENYINENQLEELSKYIKSKNKSIADIRDKKTSLITKIEECKNDKLYSLDITKEDMIKKQYEEAIQNQSKFSLYRTNINSLKKDIELLEKQIKDKEDNIIVYDNNLLAKDARITYLKDSNKELEDKLEKELNGQDLELLIAINSKQIKDKESNFKALNTKINTITINYQNRERQLKDSIEEKQQLEANIENNRLKIDAELQNNNLTEEMLKIFISKLSEMKSLENTINEFTLNLTKLDKDIETYTNLIVNHEYVDCSKLEADLSQKNIKVSEENTKFIEIKTQLGIIKNNYDRYIYLSSSIQSSLEEYKMIAKLNKLCNGTLSGSKKISLQKFVLMKLLDKILIYANKYLLNFSSSRYSLVREKNELLSDKGLDLSVFDEHTGYTRPVSSLSGGESFMSALALALGMSECIMNMHGGIKMDNIFVDEGFGSLDGDSLNNAIETLMQLAANGRMIGIISHIDTIKQMIPQTIEVVKTKSGSTINCDY